MKKGDYFKLVGAFEGALWNGRNWMRFECEACVRQEGYAVNRLQGPMTDKANAAMRGPVHFRHDKHLHEVYMSKDDGRRWQEEVTKEWVDRLITDGLLTGEQGKKVLTTHCSVIGTDGKSYGNSHVPERARYVTGPDDELTSN